MLNKALQHRSGFASTGQFVSCAFVVLLRKNIPQRTTYKLPAELSVMVKRMCMKIVILLSLLFSVSSFACDTQTIASKSELLKDIRASKKEGEEITCVKILLEPFNPSSNRYVHSVNLNIRNEKEQLVAVVSPDAYEADNGQLIYSACFSENHLNKTVLVVNTQPKQSIELADGFSHSESSLLCLESVQIELGKAIEAYGKKNSRKTP